MKQTVKQRPPMDPITRSVHDLLGAAAEICDWVELLDRTGQLDARRMKRAAKLVQRALKEVMACRE